MTEKSKGISGDWTEAECDKLREFPVWTFAMAQATAKEMGRAQASVISKIRSLKLDYIPKPTKVTKAGEPVVLKPAIVARIELALGVAAGSFAGLEKAGKTVLERLAEAADPSEPVTETE